MITLQVTDTTVWHAANVRWIEATESDLRYVHFPGDIRFAIDGADFSTHWGWVPIWDFALGLCSILTNLQSTFDEVFEFTESDDFIRFRRSGPLVEVTCSYSDAKGQVPLEDLRQTARDLSQELARRLRKENPGLAESAAFLSTIERVGVDWDS